MHGTRRIALSLVASLALGAVHAQTGVAVLEQQSIALDAPASGSARLALSVVQIDGSGWSKDQAVAAVREAGAILAQCDLSLAEVRWIRLAVPQRYLDLFTPLSRELAQLLPVPRPAIYLVRDTRNRPAFEAEAIGRGNSRSQPELADTVWMVAAVRDPGIALAHELAHVLMDSGAHSDEPGNLMREDTAPSHTRLSPGQCARMRAAARAHRLISP